MQHRQVVIGTRKSSLALVQANLVKSKIEQAHPHLQVRIETIKTLGDKVLDVSLDKIGDKGLFTKEIELHLLNGEIDLAVHSLKDLPTHLPDGLALGAITERANPKDVLISKKGLMIDELLPGALIGTSSLRRRSQLLNYRPDLNITPVRGNLGTRMEKLQRNGLDALVLAAAGMQRLGWTDRITQYLPDDVCLPAVGQGSLGIEIREKDHEIQKLLSSLHHRESASAIQAERAFLHHLQGGCQVPLGALGQIKDEVLTLKVLVGSLDGRHILKAEAQGKPSQARELGVQAAEKLLASGARQILEQVRQETDTL